jgi:hypothetical protein
LCTLGPNQGLATLNPSQPIWKPAPCCRQACCTHTTRGQVGGPLVAGSAACCGTRFRPTHISQLRSTLSGTPQLAIQTAGGPPIQPTPTETVILLGGQSGMCTGCEVWVILCPEHGAVGAVHMEPSSTRERWSALTRGQAGCTHTTRGQVRGPLVGSYADLVKTMLIARAA